MPEKREPDDHEDHDAAEGLPDGSGTDTDVDHTTDDGDDDQFQG